MFSRLSCFGDNYIWFSFGFACQVSVSPPELIVSVTPRLLTKFSFVSEIDPLSTGCELEFRLSDVDLDGMWRTRNNQQIKTIRAIHFSCLITSVGWLLWKSWTWLGSHYVIS